MFSGGIVLELNVMSTERKESTWFDDHFISAVDQFASFLSDDSLKIEGLDIADIGCGDGIIDVGVATRLKPRQLTGYDLRPTDVSELENVLHRQRPGLDLPANLRFDVSTPDRIPADDGSMDIVMSWSVFEHVSNPVAMLGEIRRIVKPTGVVFIQLWPFYRSEHGGHLWTNIEGSFEHLTQDAQAIESALAGRSGTDVTRSAVDEWRSLNRIELDDIQRALLANRLLGTKIELISNCVHIPRHLAHLPWSSLLVGGVKILAVPI